MRPALFLDRDGVINVDRNYVFRVENFQWTPGIFDLARVATARQMPIVVVTNQSGIGRGYYSEQDFEAVTAFMRAGFMAEDVPIAAVYHCPFHPEAVVPQYRAADHPFRKPRPGMILAARDDLHLDLTTSIMVGDRWSDIQAGHAAGIGTLIRVGSRPVDPEQTQNIPHMHFNEVREIAAWLKAQPGPEITVC